MKIIKIVLLFFLCESMAYSQKKVEFHYLMNEKINNQIEQPIWGMEKEFNTQRVYYNSFLFSETRLFTGDNTRSILFMIKKNTWYYKSGKNWRLFYDFKQKIGGKISIMKVKYKIFFKKKISINGTFLHKIVLEPFSMAQSHMSEYYFNPLKGIVIVKAGGTILLRSDSFQNSLNDDEINSL